MPNYTYRCTSCNEKLDLFLPMAKQKEPTEKPCSVCNEKTVIYDIKDNCPSLGDPVALGVQKVPEAFQRGVLDRIEKNVPGNRIKENNRFQH